MTADLFGPGLKAQLMQTATLPEIPDEAALLQAVSDKVGPYASQETLLWHLRASRGKVHWAVNSYLRAVLSSPHSAQEDFDPRPPLQRPLHPLASVAAAAGAPAADRQQTGSSSCSSSELSQHALRSAVVDAASKPCEEADPAAGPAGTECPHINSTAGASSSPVSPVHNSSAQQDVLAGGAAGAMATAQSSSAPAAQAGSPAAPAPVQLDALPGNVLEQVLSCLDLASLLNAACSCQAFLKAAQAEDLWRQLFQARWGAVVFPINTCGNSSGSGTSSNTSRTVWMAPVGQQLAAAAAARADAGAGTQSQARAPVPLFAAPSLQQQQHGPAHAPGSPAAMPHASSGAAAAAAAPATAETAGPCAAAAATATTTTSVSHQQLLLQQQQQQEADIQQPQGGNVGRCTGSSNVPAGGSGTCPQQAQPQSPRHSSTPGSSSTALATASPCTAGELSPSSPVAHSSLLQHHRYQQQGQRQPDQQQQQPPQGRGLAEGVAVHSPPTSAPCGSWQHQFRQQYRYAASRLCPHCGASTIAPIVYGFPSAPLLSGMAAKRLVLGGDHLIESCHVWACSGCRSCFRFYPYCNVQLWMQDDAQQQRQEHARAAGRGGGQGGAVAGEQGGAGGGGAGQQQQQQGGGDGGAQSGSDAAGHGFPRYTYEL